MLPEDACKVEQDNDFINTIMSIGCSIYEMMYLDDLQDRTLYLYGEILPYDFDDGHSNYMSRIGEMVRAIMGYNREDYGIPVEKRRPILLFINSPGGDLTEGYSLLSAIKISKTPVYTINVGEWSSMSFLIGITGHKRFSFPGMTFLLHEGSSFAGGSSNKVQDRVKFEERFKTEEMRAHVLAHSKMSGIDYDALARVEYYLLPKDALERGFIDKIIYDIDELIREIHKTP